MVRADVVVLALLPAVLWGFSPIISKRGLAAGGRSLQAACTVLTVNFLLFWGALLLLEGPGGALADLDIATVGVFVVGGLTGTALGRLAVFVGIHRVGASVNNAVISARPLFATLIALGWLGEPVGPVMGVGVVVLVIGLIVLTLSKGGDIGGWTPRDLLIPLGAALAFATGNVVRRFGLTTTDATVLQAVMINETTALLTLGGYVVLRRPTALTEVPRSTYRYFVVSGTLTAVALLSLFAAFDRGRVAVVDPIAATSPLFTTVFAYFLLRDLERVTRGIVVGSVLVVVGIVLVVSGPSLMGAIG